MPVLRIKDLSKANSVKDTDLVLLETDTGTMSATIGKVKEALGETNKSQSDWDQNDETAIDYVKGRTHYKYENPNKVLIDGIYPVEIYNNKYPRIVIDNFRIEPNVSYTVTLNGVSETSSSMTMVHIQSQNVSGQIYGDGGISHHRVYTHYLDGVNSLWIYNDSVLTGLSECHVKIEDNTEYVYQPLTEEYLPIKTFRDGEGYCSSVIGDEKAKATGSFSCAIGTGTVAKGLYSFAEGAYTEAANPAAHAEGYYTIAAGYQQHVQGKYNIEDKDSKYAHIVGNGIGGSKRSNAHTLDWDGNAWYAGTLRVGGTSYDDAKEVALKEDIPQEGSGGSPMHIITNLTLSEDVDKVIIDSDLDGNPLSLERAIIITKTRNYNDVSEKFTFCLNDGWSTTDPYVSAVNVSAKSSEDWTIANHFVIETGHSNNGDGMALVYQPLSNLTSSGVVNSAYKSTHAEIRSLVFHGKFAAGCSFYVMGKDKV